MTSTYDARCPTPSLASGAHNWKLDVLSWGVCQDCGEERQHGDLNIKANGRVVGRMGVKGTGVVSIFTTAEARKRGAEARAKKMQEGKR